MCLFINVLSCTPGPAVIVLQVHQSLYCPSHHINQSDHSTHPVLLHCMGHCHLSLLGTGRNGLPLRSVSRGAHVTWHRSHYTCHVSRMSHVTSQFTCHMSHVTCHMSHVPCHMSPPMSGVETASQEGNEAGGVIHCNLLPPGLSVFQKEQTANPNFRSNYCALIQEELKHDKLLYTVNSWTDSVNSWTVHTEYFWTLDSCLTRSEGGGAGAAGEGAGGGRAGMLGRH